MHPMGCPSSPEIYEILKNLFTEEEAEVASCMVFVPKAVDWIAKRAKVEQNEVQMILETLANKGVIYARKKDNEWGYALLPIMPGIFEFPYMKGKKKKIPENLSNLWKSYMPKFLKEVGSSRMRFSRVIPIEDEIITIPAILTYEMVYKLIDCAKTVGIAHCACRELEQKCNASREACMIFDETCDFLVQRGFARYLSKEEMKEKLLKFDEEGLVHQVNNSKDKLVFICNCCPCCCGLLRSLIELGNPNVFTGSGFIPEVDEQYCTGCRICEDERCPMHAITVVNAVANVNKEKCIGCGLCVTGCPNSALKLVRREGIPEPAETMRELGMRILEDKGKLDKFVKLNFG